MSEQSTDPVIASAQDAPVVEEVPATVEQAPPAEPEITAGTGFDIEQFMASRGFSTNQETDEDVEETSTSSSTTQTTRSSVEVTSVASDTDGPSVDVQGEGNFSGGGSATVDDVTAEDADSGTIAIPGTEVPIVSRVLDEGTVVCDDAGGMELSSDNFVFDFGPNVRTESGSTISSASIRSVASSESGLTVEVLAMEGDVELFGTVSMNGETQSIAFSTSAADSSDVTSFCGSEFFDEFIF
ncbi:hypothetical protein [Roseobacter litoralis]|uniref:hypothetical protein n=1 Tax=Roseobacter litoralis TaxID=42443 RepID=UPI0024917ABD|nr:hypothetical protein [Roseobacter litoralis]